MYEGSARDREVRRKRQAAYRAAGKHYEAVKRYRQTMKGKASMARDNAKRALIGRRYVGRCADKAQAKAINAHIKEKLSAFQRLQGRTETKGCAPGAVQTETGA
jgi:hypothetical protein